ncbi:MAG: hypothetical protein IPK79_12030 [Vampirovibrionales bacterium]|nr:hypothetical protein [Vampirovibrionales bacterium]
MIEGDIAIGVRGGEGCGIGGDVAGGSNIASGGDIECSGGGRSVDGEVIGFGEEEVVSGPLDSGGEVGDIGIEPVECGADGGMGIEGESLRGEDACGLGEDAGSVECEGEVVGGGEVVVQSDIAIGLSDE